MTKTDTAKIVYGMMTENTGIHMMDSGGGSGRMWQRNQMKSLEDFMNEPAIYMDYGPTVNIFQFFAAHLEHDSEVQEEIDKYAADHPEIAWPEVIEGVAEEQGWDCTNSYNTYNDETLLSQVYQGFEMDDNDFLIIQLHNGCDIRGGYTSPYAFRYKHGWEDFACHFTEYFFDCEVKHSRWQRFVRWVKRTPDCDFSVCVYGPDVWDRDGCPVDLDWQHIESGTCPKCNTEGSLKPYVGWE